MVTSHYLTPFIFSLFPIEQYGTENIYISTHKQNEDKHPVTDFRTILELEA